MGSYPKQLLLLLMGFWQDGALAQHHWGSHSELLPVLLLILTEISLTSVFYMDYLLLINS